MTTYSPVCYTDAGTLEQEGMVGKVRRYAFMPNAQNAWTNPDIINSLDDSNKNLLIPLINALNEEFFVEEYLFPIPSTAWNGVIDIPSDSVGLDLRDVWATNGQTTQTSPLYWAPCYRVNPNQAGLNYPVTAYSWLYGMGPRYYIENNRVMFLLPTGASSSTLGITFIKLRYFKKPSTLVSRTCCAIVTAVDVGANTVTLDVSNSASVTNVSYNPFYPFATGMTFDFLQPTQPFAFDASSVTPTNVATSSSNQVFTLASGDSSINEISVGDICTPTGTAPVLQYMPEEAINVLTQAVVVRLMDAQGNDTGLQRANQQLQVYIAQLQRLLTPKVLDQMKVQVSQNDLFSNNAMFTYGGNFFGNVGS